MKQQTTIHISEENYNEIVKLKEDTGRSMAELANMLLEYALIRVEVQDR